MSRRAPTVDQLYRSLGRGIVRFFGRTPGADCVLASHAVIACSGLDNVVLNFAVVFGDGPDGDDPAAGRLREFVARLEARAVGGYVCLSERVGAELEPVARDFGLEKLPPIPLMVRQAGPAPVPAPARGASPAVELVTGVDGLAEFLAVSEEAFALPAELYGLVVTPALIDDPAVALYLCRDGGRAVACVCLVEDEGLVCVSGMATLPERQGEGIGAHLLGHVLDSAAPGTRAFFLTASEQGQPLYRRLGFEVVDAATAWVVPPPG